MPLVYLDDFIDHLTLTLDWMTISLGLWGYPRGMRMNMRGCSLLGVRPICETGTRRVLTALSISPVWRSL